jgi:outer membrane protein assembly factor BamB
VAVTGGRIFTMGDLPAGQHVFALDEATGRRIWSTRVGGRHQDEYGGPRATPTIDGALLYVVDTDGDLVCLETATGRERWRKSLPRDFGAPTPGWMFAESPLVDGDRVVVAPGSRRAGMVAFNKATGAEIWRTALPGNLGSAGVDGPEYSSIVISNGAGVKQYVRLIGRGVIGVRASDGNLLWHYNRVANNVANIPTPIVRGNLVFASTGYSDGGSALIELVPGQGGAVAARERYYLEPRIFQNHHGGMVAIGDHIYAGKGHNNGLPICLELATGRVVWGGNTRNAGSGSAAVTAADGNLYFRYQNGMMILIEATPRAYVEKGSFEIPDVNKPSWSHPVVTGGRLYLREQDALNVYDIKR